MTYEEAREWLFSQLPMFQNVGKSAFKPGLERITKVCQAFNNPQNKFKSIHVGGTNGKGSVSHMLAAIFQAHGYKTGLYSSPHLIDFRERIKINAQLIPENDVVEFVENIQAHSYDDTPTFFEIGAAMAFHFFAKEKVDIAIIEVGMGGRLDATNIIHPIASVITNISLDHTEYLGDTRAKIAAEKAGIIKIKTPIIIGECDDEILPVFQKHSNEQQAPLFLATKDYPANWVCDLKGKYQAKNLKTVFNTIENIDLPFDPETTAKAIGSVVKTTNLLGRWQIVNQKPLTILDTAHNEAGLKEVVKQLNEEKYQKLYMVLGVVADKDLNSIIPLLPKNATYLCCQPPVSRALPAHKLQLKLQLRGLQAIYFENVETAYYAALHLAGKNDCIFIGGSTFTVGGFLEKAQEKNLLNQVDNRNFGKIEKQK